MSQRGVRSTSPDAMATPETTVAEHQTPPPNDAGSDLHANTPNNSSGDTPTLRPSPTNMSVDHIFFSLQQLESRISIMEAEQSKTKEQMMILQRRLPQMITHQEIDTRFTQLRNQMSVLQMAQQALHAQ